MDKKVTPLYLKTHTQKFDLLTIFLLDLSKKSLGALGSIVECTNLLMLDISRQPYKNGSQQGGSGDLPIRAQPQTFRHQP